jgi:hypothetical protein
MKAIHKVLLTTLIILTSSALFADPPPPPPPTEHGIEGNQDAGAPIGGGLFILLGLGAAYGGKKIYDMKKEELGG